MQFVGIVMEMLWLILKSIQDVSPDGKYFAICKKEGRFPVHHCC
jgi:hypothetical protein